MDKKKKELVILNGKTMKQYVKEKVRPSVEEDWLRLKQSPGWRKK